MKKTSFVVALLFSFAIFFNPSYAAVVAPSGNAAPKVGVPDSAALKSALAEFRSLSRKERKERIIEAKKEMKAFKANKKNGSEPSTNTLLLVILAILLPPLAVYLHEGEINNRFWIDCILTLLFFIPGIIYALIVILGDE